jgi:hypothetical protein
MLFEDFEGSNTQLNKPEGWTDEQCSAVMAYHGQDANGVPIWILKCKPSKEDIEAILAGRGIYLQVCGRQLPPSDYFPPVALWTVDAEGKPNDI